MFQLLIDLIDLLYIKSKYFLVKGFNIYYLILRLLRSNIRTLAT